MLIVSSLMRFAVLGSGSGGNSSLIQSQEVSLMIDAGLSGKQLRTRMDQMETSHLDAILLTHEHGDHVRGLKMLLKTIDAPVYTTASTAHVLRQSGIVANWKTFEAGQGFTIKNLQIESFAIQHDAVDPVGYIVRSNEKSFGFLSDAGHVTNSVIQRMNGIHAIFLEANYDENLLEIDTKRPWSIKQRIASRHGHLSNKQAAELVRTIAHESMQHIVLGHLSSDCNESAIAQQMINNILAELNRNHINVQCATQHETCGWWEIA
jgi:phosphoribosyl 1,2-cyclic phosphodiesterase